MKYLKKITLSILFFTAIFSCKKQTKETVEVIKEVPVYNESYKSYTGNLVQSYIDAPVVDIVFNDLGTVTFTRFSKGVFYIHSGNLFKENKTVFFITENYDTKATLTYVNAGKIRLETRDLNGNFQNNMLVNTPIEIRVYN